MLSSTLHCCRHAESEKKLLKNCLSMNQLRFIKIVVLTTISEKGKENDIF